MDYVLIYFLLTYICSQTDYTNKNALYVLNAGAPGRMGIVDTENHPHQDLTEFSSFTFSQSFELKVFPQIFSKY